jgi:threonyl-tRNA synthetase
MDYANEVTQRLKAAGLRAECDSGQDKVGYKVRQAQLERVPYMIVVGEREKDDGTISLRHRSLGVLGAMKLEDFLERAKEEMDSKALESLFSGSR